MTKKKPKIQKVPFYGQDWDLSEWKKMGFDSEKEASYWKKSSCAILCLKMAAEPLCGRKIKTQELIKNGLDINAYGHRNGWEHESIKKLANNLGLNTEIHSGSSLEELRSLIDRGFLVIVSIKWAFQDKKFLKERIVFWKKYGGHMALVIDYKKDGFLVHHTSTKPEYNWENKLVPYRDFENSFTGRCIALKRQ